MQTLKTLAVVFFVCLAANGYFALLNNSAANSDIFTVRNVEVDVTSDSAAQAQREAFETAQQDAFRILLQRVLPQNQAEAFQMPEPSLLQTFIRNFEIDKEQLSSIRYKASYIFRFKENLVREYLENYGQTYTDVASKPVLVLPFFQQNNAIMLWSRANPWLAAWNRANLKRGLVPVMVPIGDMEDIQNIGDNQALQYDFQGLGRMVSRYGAGEAIILIATTSSMSEQNIEPLSIFIYRTDRPEPEFVQRIFVNPNPDESKTTFYDRAVSDVYELLQQNWKDKTLITADEKNRLQVTIRFNSHQQWIATRRALENVQGISELHYLSVSPYFAEVELEFRGSEERLRLALAQQDMVLSQPHINFAAMTGPTGEGLKYELHMKRYAH